MWNLLKTDLKTSDVYLVERLGVEKFIGRSIISIFKEFFQKESTESINVFACDARVLYLISKRNRYIYEPYQRATFILPDGRPVYWLVKLSKAGNLDHLSGPNLMWEVLSDKELKKKRHMFYGGSPETVSRLKEKCLQNDVNVVDVHSPPFLSIDNLEISDVRARLKKYRPDFFWCGLGAPKQEYLIDQVAKIETNVIFVGVGLGFDYYAGTVSRPPEIVSLMGLEWVTRYIQQPLRLKRFIKPFFFILTLIILHNFKSIGQSLVRRD